MDNVIEVWTSSVRKDNSGMEKKLEKQDNICFGKSEDNAETLIVYVDDEIRYQKMDGFGISITEGSAYLCGQVLQKDKREELLKVLFSETEGIGISMLRQPIGATDHCTKPYGFAEEEQDGRFLEFDFSAEEERVLPTVEGALKYADHKIKILAAPWTAPAWMKTNGSVLGVNLETCQPGRLRVEMEHTYAEYLAAFVREYEKRGIPIYGISMVNEPDFANYAWPTMPMTPEQAGRIAVKYLAPELKKQGLNTKIMCWDHNFDSFNYMDGEYVERYYSDPEAYEVTAGSAWHWYEGDSSTLTKIKRNYPEKEIWLTEGSGGEWGYKQWKDAFVYETNSVINICRNFAQSVIYWNMVLDECSSPDYYYTETEGAHSQNRGLVTIDRKTGEIQFNTDFYTMGHFSKFVRPDAVRIESTNYSGEKINTVAFLNPDGAKVINISNESDKEKRITVQWGDKAFTYVLPALSLNTFIWNGEKTGELLKGFTYNSCGKKEYCLEGKNLCMDIMKQESEERGIRVIHRGAPENILDRGVTFKNENGQKYTDITGYGYLTFQGKNLRYYKGFPATVTFVDARGCECTLETREKVPYDRWEDIFLPLEKLSGVDRRRIAEIRVAFKSQDRDIFLIRDLRFTFGYEPLAQKKTEHGGWRQEK